jgi:hypothetical protein
VADLLAQSKLKNVAIAVFNKAWRVKKWSLLQTGQISCLPNT